MPSIGSILSIAGTALRTQQAGMEVVSHNIANVNTEGYSRQRPDLRPGPVLVTPDGVFGTGVDLQDVERLRDVHADASYRDESGLTGWNEARSGLISRVETVLAEPGEEGLSGALDRFFSSWSELSVDPGSTSLRARVLEAGQEVASELNRLSEELAVVRSDAEDQLGASISRVNTLAEEVAALNRDIVSAESGGQTAGDLRDARDRALDEMASLVPLAVVHRDDGSVGVAVEGVNVVDGAATRELSATVSGSTIEIRAEGSASALPLARGKIRGILEVLNDDLPGWRADLDAVAGTLVDEVNAIHRTGTSPDGTTGADFFDPTATLAADIRLDAAVAGTPEAVAAGTGTAGPPPEYRAGANDVALALAELRDDPTGALGDTFGGAVSSLVSDVGAAVRQSANRGAVHRTLADQWSYRRESTSGVSVDEELIHLVRFQSAYAAAARVVTTADRMLESLINM